MTEESRRLASYGRYGDNNLVHVSNRELAGLETLTGRRFTKNPHTGLPEAFGFEDLIPAIAGAVATIATSGAAAPALYGALASAAAGTAVGAAKGENIGTALTSGLISGIGSYAGAGVLGGVAEAAGGAATGTATNAATGAATGAATDAATTAATNAATNTATGAAGTEAIGASTPSGGGFMGTGSPLPGGAGATPVSGNAAVNAMNNFYGGTQAGGMPDTSRLDAVAGGYQTSPVANPPASAGFMGQAVPDSIAGNYNPPPTLSIADRASMNLGNVVNNPTGALDKIGSNLTTLDGLKGAGMLAGSAYMASTLAPLKKPKLPGETPWDYNSTIPATSRPMTAPGPGYRPGFSPEARYFADGGPVRNESEAPDYDYEGARRSGLRPDSRGHLPDTYKLPNHITFSDDSVYSTEENPGGHWQSLGRGQWAYEPSETVLRQHGPEALRRYFQEHEKGNRLLMQPGMADGGPVYMASGGTPPAVVAPGIESLKNIPTMPYVSSQLGDPNLQYIGAMHTAPTQMVYPGSVAATQVPGANADQGTALDSGVVMPPSSYRPGFSPEWNYLPNAPKYLQPYLNGTFDGGSVGNSGGGAGAGSGDSGSDGASSSGAAAGGWVHNGHVNYPIPPERHAKGGIASLGSAHHGTTANIVHEAKAAMLGEHPHPKQALQRFRETFGDSALRALSESFAEGGRIRGAGGGLDDLVPGTIEGRQKVRLADGEFVVSSDVVSALGDGSTDQGVRKLQEMMNRVRRDKTGKVKQPGPISDKVLPA